MDVVIYLMDSFSEVNPKSRLSPAGDIPRNAANGSETWPSSVEVWAEDVLLLFYFSKSLPLQINSKAR